MSKNTNLLTAGIVQEDGTVVREYLCFTLYSCYRNKVCVCECVLEVLYLSMDWPLLIYIQWW